MSQLSCRLFVFFVGLLTAGTASAEGFGLYEFSARSLALGGAVMARKPDSSVIASNPALITKLKGTQVQAGVTAIAPKGTLKTTGLSTSLADKAERETALKSDTWFIPSSYITQELNESFTLGAGIFSRFGMGFEYPRNWPGRFSIYEASLTTASLNPNLAWAVTEELSLAGGVEIMYSSMDLRKRTLMATPTGVLLGEVDSNIQDADSISYGFNLAAHYQFNDQWAAGLSYRSKLHLKNTGDVTYSLVNDARPPFGSGAYKANFKNGEAWSKVVLPESVAGGISWTPVPELSFEVGAIWTRWSRFVTLDIHLPDMPNPANRVSRSPKKWEDSWRYNAGVEYQATDWLALRAGYVYDTSPMTEQYEDYLVPSTNRHIYSAGVGFNWAQWTLDLTYAFIDVNGRAYHGDKSLYVLPTDAGRPSSHMGAVSLGYAF